MVVIVGSAPLCVKWFTFHSIIAIGISSIFLLFLPVTSGKPSTVLKYSKVLPSQEHHKPGTLPSVLSSWERGNKIKDKLEADKKSKSDLKRDTYDFIVVGAGTAGSIVASRLTDKNKHLSVLLIEAGGQPHASHDNPAMSMVMAKHSETDWMYSSVVQNETCILCPGKKYIFSAGKILGGSANLNYLETLYEGAFQDYSEWMEITKDPNWGYYMLQPYFKTVKQFMKKNYPVSNGESQWYRSTYKALVRPVPNLEVQKYSHVNKVIFDEKGRAKGVEYERHGSTLKAFARKEVIISAGNLGSPKILMLSGIGPKHLLESHNISLRMDLPTGKNFQDHLAIPLGPFFRSKAPSESSFKFLDSTKIVNAEAWNSSTVLRMPLINLNYNLYSKEMSHFLGINENALKNYMDTSLNKFQKITGSDSMFINVALKKPVSRGVVEIAGDDPKLGPIVNPNYLNAIYHEDSLAYSSEKQNLIEGLEETVRLIEDNSNLQSKFTEVPFPGCETYIFRGYGYWNCYINHFSMSFNHGTSTCSMGTSTYPSVVNPELKVHGIPNLRVVDASVIPTIPGTFPFLTVAVVAERASEMIIREHRSTRNFEQEPTEFKIESQPLTLVSSSSTTESLLVIHEQSQTTPNPITIPTPSIEESPFSGFRIKKLTPPKYPTVATPLKSPLVGNVTFSLRKSWQNSEQILKAYTHNVGSILSEDDLIPPGEPQSEKLNPSYFSVMPFGKVIFYPLVPTQVPSTTSTEATPTLFKFKLSF